MTIYGFIWIERNVTKDLWHSIMNNKTYQLDKLLITFNND